jgi:hypothetical protein
MSTPLRGKGHKAVFDALKDFKGTLAQGVTQRIAKAIMVTVQFAATTPDPAEKIIVILILARIIDVIVAIVVCGSIVVAENARKLKQRGNVEEGPRPIVGSRTPRPPQVPSMAATASTEFRMGALALFGCFMTSLDNHTSGLQISSVLDRLESRHPAILEKYRLGRSQGIHIDVGEGGSDLHGEAVKVLLVIGVGLLGRFGNFHALGRFLGGALDSDGENLVLVLAAARLGSFCRSGDGQEKEKGVGAEGSHGGQ